MRWQLTVQMSNAETLLNAQPFNVDELMKVWKLSTEIYEKVNQLNELIIEDFISEDINEGDLDNKFKVQGEYKLEYFNLEIKVTKVMTNSNMLSAKTSIGETEGQTQKQRRLPTIRVPVFNGEIRDWIGWWTQFKGIHQDRDLDQSAKFVYLKQAKQPGTRAADLVNSYPPTKENYSKVIKALEDRFGNKEILIEVYVRELISLMVETAKSERRKSVLGKKTVSFK